MVKADHLDDLVRLGTLTRPAARFLDASVAAGLNILVAGGTQAGKTTMLNCLAAAIPSRERVVTCEEVFELKIPLRDVAAMQCRQPSLEGTGEIPLRRLVKEALRMRPSRIIVGEVRQAESLDLLIALNSGIPGMCTLHANSAREAITKICTLPLLAGENVGSRFVVPTVAGSVDLVVHVALERDGVRRVREIVAVPGRVEGDVIETADLFVQRQGELVRADGFPPHRDRFERAGYDVAALLAEGALRWPVSGWAHSSVPGVFCIWWSFWPRETRRPSSRTGLLRRLVRPAGAGGVRHADATQPAGGLRQRRKRGLPVLRGHHEGPACGLLLRSDGRVRADHIGAYACSQASGRHARPVARRRRQHRLCRARRSGAA